MENYTQKEPIRILNVVPNMRAAGIETFIMNVYRNIDRKKVQFDFLVHNEKKEFYDDEIEKLGGRIYRLSFKDDKNIIKYIKDLNDFFKEHKEYKIVHGHMQSMMPLYLYIAKKNKVPVRIAHSHNGNYEKTIKGFILHVFSRMDRYVSTNNWACSNVAGKYLFGNKEYDIIYNGINVEKFKFDLEIRNAVRKENDFNDKFVIGNIARFEIQKNHKFLIDVFYEFQKINSNAILVLIGEGKLKKKMESYVMKMNIQDKVKFLGIRKDTERLYQAMDCFLLPSLYEGLPVVGIEAQVSGLHCIFSDTITKEVQISPNTVFLGIKEKNIEDWKNSIFPEKEIKRNSKINMQKYDIKSISNLIERKYIEYEKD